MNAIVIDANAMRLSDSEIRSRINEVGDVSIVGFPLHSEMMSEVRALTEIARSALPKATIVLGGPHATALPDDTLNEYPDVDFILRGECEDVFPAFARVCAEGGDYSSLHGVSYREGVETRHCPTPQPPDISRIPFPARDLLDQAYREGRYYSLMIRTRPVETMLTSRGCPFRCSFCYNTKRTYRFRAADDVFNELVGIHERGIDTVEIVDDNFSVDRSRSLELFGLLKKEKLRMRFRIKCRVDSVDEEFLLRARDAGVYQVSYGMESGVQELLDAMRKGTTVEQNAKACAMTKAAGMACHTSWIVGFPGDTPERIWQTVGFIRSIAPTTVNIEFLKPYPFTEVYMQAKEKGMLVNDWTSRSEAIPWVKLQWMKDKCDVEHLLRRIYRSIYLRPRYIWQFGSLALLEGNMLIARYALQQFAKTIRN